nr:hypothetical protein [Flavobacterium sp. ASV13]
MKKKLLLLVLIIMSSCSNNDAINSTKKSLQGKWNWVSSSGGFAGTTETPKSTNKVIYIEFSGSSYKKYIDEQLAFDYPFEIKTQKSIFGGERPMIVSTDSSKYFPAMSFEFQNNELHLSEECYDCFGSVYVRVK